MSGKGKPRDGWDKAEVIGTLLSGLLIPFVLLLIGNMLNDMATTREQSRRDSERELETERRRVDRASELLEGLAQRQPAAASADR
jgi:hypothetical protein